MEKFIILFYEDTHKNCFVENFLDSLDTKTWAKVIKMIKVLSECGNSLREPYTKYLSNGIFELRIISSGNHIRLLFFYKDKRTIVLTNGFVKKTAKTPKKELELAIKRKTEYLSRGETNEEL